MIELIRLRRLGKAEGERGQAIVRGEGEQRSCKSRVKQLAIPFLSFSNCINTLLLDVQNAQKPNLLSPIQRARSRRREL